MFSGVRVAQSLVVSVKFCRSLFVLLFFFMKALSLYVVVKWHRNTVSVSLLFPLFPLLFLFFCVFCIFLLLFRFALFV